MPIDQLTPEQQKLLNRELATSVKSMEELKSKLAALGTAGAEAYDQLERGLKDTLGTQEQFATESEKLLLILQDSLKVEEGKLQAMNNLNAAKEAQAQLEETILKHIDDSTALTATIAAAENKRLEYLEEKKKKDQEAIEKLEAGLVLETRTTQEIRDRIGVIEEERETKEKIVGVEENIEALTESRMEDMFSIKNSSGDLADILGDVAEESITTTQAFAKMSETMTKVFSTANLVRLAINKMKDAASDFKKDFLAMGSPLEQFTETAVRFTRETGGKLKFGEEMRQLKIDMIDNIYTSAQTDRAYQTLFASSRMFVDATVEQRAALTLSAATMERFAVDANTVSESFDHLNKTFGSTPKEVTAITEEMVKFARELKVGPNKMLGDFNKHIDIVAYHGKEKGVKVFKELAVTAAKTKVSMSELLTVVGRFDTFEGAAEAASSLNLVLGGPLLNSTQLMMANESERIEMIRDAVKKSGKDFSELGKQGKLMIADQLGIGVAATQKLLSDQNISSVKEATEAIQGQADASGELGEAAKDTQTIQDAATRAAEAQIVVMEHLGGAINRVKHWWQEFKQEYPEIIVFWETFSFLIVGAATAVVGLWAAFKLFKGLGAIFAMAATPLGAMVLGIAALTAGAALIFMYWDDIVEKLEVAWGWVQGIADTAKGVLNAFRGTWDIIKQGASDWWEGIKENFASFPGLIKDAAMGALKWLGSLWTDFMDFIKSGAAVAKEAAEYVSTENIWGFTKDIVGLGDDKAADMGLTVVTERLANGTTNFAGGLAMVGERGPELVVLPQGSDVVSNANVQRLANGTPDGMDEMARILAASSSGGKEQTINITLVLDGDVLARHTAKIASETITEMLEFA